MIPLGDRLLIQPAEATELKRGSIIIPESARSRPQEGLVVARGKACTQVTVGDHVLYGRYAGLEVIYLDTKYVILKECDVLAVLSPSNPPEASQCRHAQDRHYCPPSCGGWYCPNCEESHHAPGCTAGP